MGAEEWVGWASAAILLATIVQQVWTQWKTRSTAGVSKWLFIGQTLASVGFTAYSAMTGNAVFTTVNAALLASAILGQLIYLRNRRAAKSGRAAGKSN
jgi:MtN3 and saliva related transmembrane protein